MKTLQKTSLALAGSLGLVATLAFSYPAKAAPGGTDITHFTVNTVMTNTGIESGAAGSVAATQKTQGNADNQTLTVSLSGLSTNMTYDLVAIYDTDTNAVEVESFTPDSKGKATFSYRNLGNGKGGGKKGSPLPDQVNPVSLIRELDVVDTNLQVVLSADLTSPDKLSYLIKRNLGSGQDKASLMIQATTQQTHFRLSASGLEPNADYWLAFNGEVVQTNTASTNGKLTINALNDTPPYILDVRSVELWDTSTNLVLQTDIP